MRRTGIGGSDVAALIGLDRYRSPWHVYLEKRGELPGIPRSDALERAAEWGHLLEPLIAQRFAAKHDVSVRRVGLLRSASDPWRMANLDRQVAGCPDGPCLLEIKSRSAYKASEWGESGSPDGVPDSEAVQTHHYMGVTGYRHAHVSVLINGNDDRHYRVEFDPQIEADLLAMERGFWQRILDGDPPPVDGHEATTELLAVMWQGREKAEKVIPAAEVEPLRAEMERLKAEAKRLEGDAAAIGNKLAFMLGDAEEAVWEGETLFSRRQNGTFASKRFAQEHPELAAKYTRLVDAIDTKALAADEPQIYRAYRARILRFPGGNK